MTYDILQPLVEGFVEIANGEPPQRFPLPHLDRGRHQLTIPAGTRLAEDGPTVTCEFARNPAGITIAVGSLYSAEDAGEPVYDYTPGPLPSDYGDQPADDAAAFRGDDRAITAFRIPGPRNVLRRNNRQGPELEFRGVGFQEGTPMTCSKGIHWRTQAVTAARNVKVISTASHTLDASIPVLVGGTVVVPLSIASPANAMWIVGSVRAP